MDPVLEVKSGVKTSEFWMALVTQAAGLALLVYGVVTKDETAMVVGAALAGLPSGMYSVGRGLAKKV